MIILGKDGKEYPNVKACIQADAEYDEKIAKEKAQEEAKKRAEEAAIVERKAEISKRKKELSNAIEKAEGNLKIARTEYNNAKERAEKIMAAARKEAQLIINDAKDFLKSASTEKINAISAFNKEFGPFTTVLTGEDAQEEYNRLQNIMEENLKRFFKWFN